MDTSQVERGFEMLKRFAERNGLGKPDQVLTAEPNPDGWLGVGCEWKSADKRTAIRLGKELSEEAEEIKRRAREWMA